MDGLTSLKVLQETRASVAYQPILRSIYLLSCDFRFPGVCNRTHGWYRRL